MAEGPLGPIDWGAHDGDLVERALAVMLLQDRPHAWRRVASRGDAGVDVADPEPDGYEVFQIKSFTGSLTTARENQIRKSFERILAGGELARPVVAWRLLVPMGPTKEMEAWFRTLTTDAPFDCEWLGASRVDLLAASNPHVVDYYFRDGKARVEQRYRDLLQARALIESADTGPRPAEVKDSLRELLEALNRDDPHYRYAYEASHHPPLTSAEGARPGLVMSATECDGDRGCITMRVFARHRHAVEDRPIRARTSVAVVERRAGNRGKSLMCKEVNGAFEFEMRITDPAVPDATVNLAAWSVIAWGRPPERVRAGVGLLASMASPSELDAAGVPPEGLGGR